MMDNRIFNVNGRGKDDLLAVLKIAFNQEGKKTTAKGYFIDPKLGMVLLWHNDGKHQNFPSGLTAESVVHVVWDWLESGPEIECEGWDADYDHDGSNSEGWRVFCEDWGHVGGNSYAIVAIKPAFMWHGK
jgi:hypothetical protein